MRNITAGRFEVHTKSISDQEIPIHAMVSTDYFFEGVEKLLEIWVRGQRLEVNYPMVIFPNIYHGNQNFDLEVTNLESRKVLTPKLSSHQIRKKTKMEI